MTEPDYTMVSMIVIGGLLLSVFLLPDLVAVVIIVATLTGLVLRGLQEKTPNVQERKRQRDQNW